MNKYLLLVLPFFFCLFIIINLLSIYYLWNSVYKIDILYNVKYLSLIIIILYSILWIYKKYATYNVNLKNIIILQKNLLY